MSLGNVSTVIKIERENTKDQSEKMCDKRNRTKVRIRGKVYRIDDCIAQLVARLNDDIGLKTVASCCGHGKYPMTIVIHHRRFDINYDFCSGKEIPRKKKFYKKDKDGYYFIPESIGSEGLK